MADNVLQIKSFEFAIRIVRLYKYLTGEKKEYVMSKQILRAGTSIGANIEEGLGGQSKKDFIAKLSIAYKEARETDYWLRILKETDYLTKKQFDEIYADLQEIQKILIATLKTTQKNMKTKNKEKRTDESEK